MAPPHTDSTEATDSISSGRALALCLQRVASHHAISVTPQSLVSGLPTTLDAFSPDLLVRSAKRAGIKARLQNVAISELPSNALPVIALLDGDKSVVVEAINADGNAIIYDPESGAEPGTVGLSDLQERSSGFVLLARPKFRLSASQLGGIGMQSEHWFWSVMLEHRGL